MKLKILIQSLAVSLGGVLAVQGQESAPVVVQAVYEVFALGKAEAAAIQRENLTGVDFYARMMKGLESGKVVQKKLLAVRGLPGQMSATKSVSEYLYPTEFDPPELPNSIGVSVPAGEKSSPQENLERVAKGPGWQAGVFPATPATPSAFETAMLGDTLETEIVVGEGADPVISLRFASNHTVLLGKDSWGQGLSKMEMPQLGTQRSSSSVMVKSGVPICAGTISPGPEEQPKEGDEQVWFSFFTVTLIEVKE